MTRQEAIMKLEMLIDLSQQNELKNMHEALSMAIRSLEVVKGEWTYKGLDFEVDSLYQCSACKHYHWSKSNYCPNCGADMRGEEDDS